MEPCGGKWPFSQHSTAPHEYEANRMRPLSKGHRVIVVIETQYMEGMKKAMY